ncbi:MAG TPA: hypothetical protein DCE41_25725, partial [Cytophagales bacterium]|nr:hypothetical protein [Cytophagales bacterium]
MSDKMQDPASLVVSSESGYQVRLDAKKALVHVLGAFGAAANPLAWGKVAKEVGELLRAVSLESTTEKIAYQYINECVVLALGELLKAYQNWFEKGDIDLTLYADSLASILQKIEFTITPDFFQHPERLEAASEVKKGLTAWLKETELSEDKVKTMVAAFPPIFLRQLISTWHSSNASAILERFDHPFQQAWNNQMYRAHLASYYDQPVLDNKQMRLADLYIEPQFFTYVECFREEDDRRFQQNEQETNEEPFKDPLRKLNLHGYISRWLVDEDPLDLEYPNTQVQMLMGYPGQGKTSFCSRLLHDCIRKGAWDGSVLHVKLRNLKESRVTSLVADPLETIIKYMVGDDEHFKAELKVTTMGKALWVLDGLDELYMKSGLSKDAISSFCCTLARELEPYPQVKLLLTSRYGYVTLRNLPTSDITTHRLELMTVDQQIQWLRNFNQFTPTSLTIKNLKEIPNKSSAHNHLKEFVNQPILLHLLATNDKGLHEIKNKTALYESLFDTLIKRKWSADKTLKQHKKLKEQHLKDYLGFVALKIYQSPYEYVRLDELEGHKTDEFKKKLQGVPTENALSALMMSFYMRQVEGKTARDREDENYAIEFLHKSLVEYLVAHHIYNTALKLSSYDGDTEEYDSVSPEDILGKLYPVLGPQHISVEVHGYLVELLQGIPMARKKALFELLSQHLEALILRDFYLEGVFSLGKVPNSPLEQAMSVFYGYWTVLSYLTQDQRGADKSLPSDIIPKKALPRFFQLVLTYRQHEDTPLLLSGLEYPNLQGG